MRLRDSQTSRIQLMRAGGSSHGADEGDGTYAQPRSSRMRALICLMVCVTKEAVSAGNDQPGVPRSEE